MNDSTEPAAQAPAATAPILALDAVSVSFGSVRALRSVSLELATGRVHALAGENGAGKSTLVKVLAGVLRPESGRVLVDGEPAVFHGPADARAAGIAVIYQEPTVFPHLSIAENIYMGRQPRASPLSHRLGRIDRAKLRRWTADLFARLGVALDLDQPRGLSIADQQMVEIAKALSFDARVLIMDEPTAALTPAEVDRLFSVARALRAGFAILFISHRLDEIFELCETAGRDGARRRADRHRSHRRPQRRRPGAPDRWPRPRLVLPEAGHADRRGRARRARSSRPGSGRGGAHNPGHHG